MRTIYIKEKDFKGYKIIKEFPNENFKEINIDGEILLVHIIKPDLVVTIKDLTQDQKDWYLMQKITDEVIGVNCSWFPKELFAGVEKRVYSSFTELSKKTGWILPRGNAGSNQEFFLKSKKQTIINILKSNNFDNINDLTTI